MWYLVFTKTHTNHRIDNFTCKRQSIAHSWCRTRAACKHWASSENRDACHLTSYKRLLVENYSGLRSSILSGSTIDMRPFQTRCLDVKRDYSAYLVNGVAILSSLNQIDITTDLLVIVQRTRAKRANRSFTSDIHSVFVFLFVFRFVIRRDDAKKFEIPHNELSSMKQYTQAALCYLLFCGFCLSIINGICAQEFLVEIAIAQCISGTFCSLFFSIRNNCRPKYTAHYSSECGRIAHTNVTADCK